jgi:hypothetical protein
MLELPDGIGSDDPRLFGFFVYELRVGHDGTRGCTAQGRWGQPLRITGVQHPAPQLRCSVARTEEYIVVSAPFAMPVIDGQNARSWPRSRLYALLYAQVVQADGASWRNVLLTRTLLEPRQHDIEFAAGVGRFFQDNILTALQMLGLRPDAPLSVLCVETLPEPDSPFADPLGANLGQVRFLRTSTLTPVPEICPPDG